MNNNSIDDQEKNFNPQPSGKDHPFRDIGLLIKTLREGEGYSKAKLADLVPCGSSTLEQWESGSVLPKQSNVVRLAEIFRTSPQNIVMGMSCLSTSENETPEQAELTNQVLSEITTLQPATDDEEPVFNIVRTPSKGMVAIDIAQMGHYVSLDKSAIIALFISAGLTVADAEAIGGWE